MRFGVNFDIRRLDILEKVKARNVDYVEFVFRDIANASEEDYKNVTEWKNQNSVEFTHANAMLMPEYILLGENATPKADVAAFLEKGLARANELGCKSIIFGSGVSRRFPDGMSRETAYNKLYEYISLFCETAKPYGIDIVIEPLNSYESNVFNTVKETYDFIKKYGKKSDNLFLLADSYHMLVENESFDVLNECKDMLRHTHIAASEVGDKTIREFPTTADTHNIKAFITALRKIGYTGDVTVEASCGKTDYCDAVAEAMTALKSW